MPAAKPKATTAQTGTVRPHRVLATKPEKVYRAFTEPDAMAKWLPPHGFTCTVHTFDARVGGSFRMSFRNFTTGKSHSFGGEYVALVPYTRIEYTDRFDDPNLPGTMRVTIGLKECSCGTEIAIEQSGIPAVIPPEACYLGWQQSLIQLAQLVEPDIPGIGDADGGRGCAASAISDLVILLAYRGGVHDKRQRRARD